MLRVGAREGAFKLAFVRVKTPPIPHSCRRDQGVLRQLANEWASCISIMYVAIIVIIAKVVTNLFKSSLVAEPLFLSVQPPPSTTFVIVRVLHAKYSGVPFNEDGLYIILTMAKSHNYLFCSTRKVSSRSYDFRVVMLK